MSKFLKFIVHAVIFCTILGILALVVPPFAGISTTIIDSLDQDTNLPFGSVTYAREVDTGELSNGDAVLLKDSGAVYRYILEAYDEEGRIHTVRNARDPQGESKEVTLGSRSLKPLFTVPGLGFLMMSVQSTEGLIILGLGILFLIILYIIAELWSKDPKKNEEDGPDVPKAGPGAVPGEGPVYEPGHIKTKKELKMEEKARIQREKEEERRIRAEEKAAKKAQKKAIRMGGFVDEVEEEEIYGGIQQQEAPDYVPMAEGAKEEKDPSPEQPSLVTQDTQTLPPLSKEQEEKAPDREEPLEEEPQKETGHTSETEPKTQEASPEPEPEAELEPAVSQEIKKMAIPLYTAEELMKKSREAGEIPEVYKDDLTGVTLLDYSEIIAGASGKKEEK